MRKTLLFSFLIVVLSVVGQNSSYKEYIPVPLPKWSEPTGKSENDLYLLQYEIATGTESIKDTNSYFENNEYLSTSSFIPDGLGTQHEVIGSKYFTDLEKVNSTSTYPASGNVKLLIKYPGSNSTYVGSGIMVSKNIVLTAGHCIYNKDLGGWANYVKVVPGYKNGVEPFGNAYANTLYSWNPWTKDKNYEWDMGFILLNKCLGIQSGYFGIGTYNDSFFTSNNFHNFSYPSASPYTGQTMYYRHGYFDDVSDNILYFNNASYGGQSGSGFYYIDVNGNRCNYAVLSHSTVANNTGCTRITTPKFNYIKEIINANENCNPNGYEYHKENLLAFTIFPNPCSDHLFIAFDKVYQSVQISIINLMGKKVKEIQSTSGNLKETINLTDIEPGFYVVEVFDGMTRSTEPIILLSGN